MTNTTLKIFKPLHEHKIKTLLSLLLFTGITFIFAFIKPNVYIASTDIEVGMNNSPYNTPTPHTVNLDTEIKIIKSRKLIKKAMGRGNFQERYYATSYIKETELYNAVPFEITLSKGEDLSLYITATKGPFYLLEVEGIDSSTLKKWKISKIYNYGIAVKENHFSFTLFLKKNQKLIKNMTYRFTMLSPRSFIDITRDNIVISRANEMSNTLNISYKDTIPSRTQEFVNVLAEVYLEQSIQRKTLESSKILNFIDKQLEGINNKLQHSEQNLEKFKKQSKIVKVGKTTENIGYKISEYQEKIVALSEEEQVIDVLYQQINIGKNFTDISTVGLNLSSTGLPRLIQELQETLKERKNLRVNYTAAHPKVRKLTQNISHTQNSIVSTVKNLKTRIVKRKNLLTKTMKEYNELLNTLPEKEKIFGGLQRKFIVNEKIYAYILEKRASTAISKASTVSASRIIDTAVKPIHPIEPKRTFIVIIGALFGLVFGIILSYLLSLLNNRIKEENDIRENSSLALLGSIPFIHKENNKIKVFESPKSVVSEAFRALRGNLQFLVKVNNTMVISVTSSIGGEGKSTISSNLAAIVSLTGKKTIILNMDMRKPTLHKKFDLENTQGMSTLLSGKVSLESVIQKTQYDNIYVIASGPIPPNPSELIDNNTNMLKIVEALKSVYDVIIFDTPPIGLVSDAITLMQLSDITLFVLRSEYSKKSFLTDISRLKEEQNIKGLTLLLNGVKTYKDGYGYYEED
ncbi:MAG: polysaccharide biosynthesis tyrosine autokinase [Bacteroidales bacterium]|nr:polysaccharide biosynthesis tyrosine autokinase [Bacteroidales bacterium]